MMRGSFLALALAAGVASFAAPSAKAEGSRWCIELGGGMGGSSNCGYETLEQCKETLLGQSGFCRPNPFFKPARENASEEQTERAPRKPRQN